MSVVCFDSASLPLLIEFKGSAVFQHMAEDMPAQVRLRYHVPAFTGRALFCQLVEFCRKVAQDTVFHVSAKEDEVFLRMIKVVEPPALVLKLTPAISFSSIHGRPVMALYDLSR